MENRAKRTLNAPGGHLRLSQGAQTRQKILETGVDIASVEGLEGLTIGRLATELEMSKSGLFAHFGSKEELQLATLETARAIFVEEVIRPALVAERGLARLHAMLEAWISYVERGVFRGGCFFAAASAEFDGRPGPVRDQVARVTKSWLDALEDEVHEAQSLSQLNAKIDPAQLAFELHSFGLEANWASQLQGDKRAFDRARQAIQRGLESAATAKGVRTLRLKTPAQKAKAKK